MLFVLLVVSHDYRGIMANKKQEPFTNTCVHLEGLDGAVFPVVLVFFVFCCCLVSFRLVSCMPNVVIVYMDCLFLIIPFVSSNVYHQSKTKYAVPANT